MKSTLAKITLLSFLFLLFIPHFTSAETKTFIKEYTYQASEDDSRNSSRTLALREVKRLLLEELGTYLESVTEVQNFQLTKDKIFTLTAGIVQTEIVDERWDGRTYWLRAKIAADSGDITKNINALRNDREKTKELEEVRKKSDEQLREITRLRKELAAAKDVNREKGKAAYNNAISSLTRVEWFEKGYAYNISGDYGNAINAFTKAIELDQKYANAYVNRGFAHYKLGNYRQAIENYDKAIEINPKHAMAFNNRGVAYEELGKYRQAIEDYDKAIELNPKYGIAHYNRSVVYGKLGNYRQKFEDLNKYTELDPKNANAYISRGNAYEKLSNYRQAIEDYDKAIELDPKYANAYYSRGAAYYKIGNREQCFEDLKTAARLGDKNAQDYLKREKID
jgi:tetratricopeptide (TPR) repeat protein